MKQTTLVIVLLLLATAAVAKQHDENPLRQLDALAGNWQCTGMAFDTPWFPAHPTQGEVTQKWILDGKWLAFTCAEKKTAENPMPFTATGYFGYDPESKMYVVGGVDSTGGYSTGASKGWMNDALTFEGPWHIGGMTAKARDTFTRKSATEVMHTGELEYEGKWMKLSQETCLKK
jgi:Protein of unknown function (DUF1579)